jgi:hypothetical protein
MTMAMRIKAIFHSTQDFKIVGFCPPAMGTPEYVDKNGKHIHRIHQEGCLLTACSMLLNKYGIITNPHDLNDWLKAKKGFDKNNGMEVKLRYAFNEYSKGQVIWVDTPLMCRQVKEREDELHHGYPLLLRELV